MRFLDFMSTRPGRAIRVALGFALIVLGALQGGGWWALAAFALLPLVTGVAGVCPVSPLFGRPWRGGCGTGSGRKTLVRRSHQ